MGPVPRRLVNVSDHRFQCALLVRLLPIHGAEAALVEAASQRGLDDQVAALAGRAVEGHVVIQAHLIRGYPGLWKTAGEGTAFTLFTGNLQFTIMAIQNVLYDGQPQAGTS